MAWSKLVPATTDSPCNSVPGITSNWTAWNLWIGIEHYNMSDIRSGRHKPGIVSVLPSGTAVQMSAQSAPGTGAIWWDTTYGTLRVYRTSGWNTITSDYYSRIALTKGTQSLALGNWNLLIWDVINFDGLSEYTLAANLLVVAAEGYYFIKVQGVYPTGDDVQKGMAIYKDGTQYSQAGNYGTKVTTVELDDVVYCAAGAVLSFYAFNGKGSAITLTKANVSIVRLS